MQLEFIITFRGISHKNFITKDYFPLFLKAAWQSYKNKQTKNLSLLEFQSTVTPVFEILFLQKDDDLDAAILNLKQIFTDIDKFEHFLNDTFYIILNIYVKSFYGQDGAWSSISAFVNAIEDFISYAVELCEIDSTTDIFKQDLAASFTQMKNNHENITVYNAYYGVPVQSQAEIIDVDENGILIKAPRNQLAAAKHAGGIYILKSKYLEYDIYADAAIKYINKERFLKLTRFHWLKKPLFKRKNIRVRPLKSVRIDAVNGSEMVALNLYDISLGGVATIGKDASLAEHKVVTLYFPSEILSDFKMVEGSLVEDSKTKDGKVYHFQFNLTKQQEALLSQYISNQERRIIQMLRQEVV